MNLFSKRNAYYQGPVSDHFDGKRFFNPWDRHAKSLYKVLYWKMTSKPKPWPIQKAKQFLDIPPKSVEGNQLRVTFVGHSTVLIQTQGLNFITDPIWSNRASPFKHFGPSRYSYPGISYENLPPIDFILISHNHYDHLDIPTIKKIFLKSRPLIITPLGNDAIIHKEIPDIKVEILDWGQSIPISKNVAVHLAPTQHWSARNLYDYNQALWGSFIISTPGGNIYFSGDTGYGQGDIFRSLFEKFGSFRFAMLPIGAYEPRWFMKYAHMNPEEAVLAYKDLGEPYATAIHYETFRLTNEGFKDPGVFLKETCEKLGVCQSRFRALKAGESWMVPEV